MRAAPATALLLCALSAAAPALAEEETAASLADAFKQGKVSLALRYRAENVSDDAFADDGRASTLRTALGFRTLAWHRLVASVELQNVADLGLGDEHNNLGAGDHANGVTDRPGVGDPALTRAQQFGLRTTWVPRTTVGVGRQEVALGNERFVGPAGFRQNHQSFDALRAEAKPLERLRLNYLYLARVHTVTGDSKGMGSHVVYGELDAGSQGTATFYALRVDYDAPGNAALSSSTWGAQWRGTAPLGQHWKLPYLAEWAEQSDAGDNPSDYDAGYLFFEAGVQRDHVDVRAGFEKLEGDPLTGAFTTPLATLFKFNGWADKFTTTPAAGLEDLYLSATFTRPPWTGIVAGHDFASDKGGVDFGRELDARLEWQSSWKQVVGLQLAFYDAEDFSTDTNKVWLYTGWGL